MKNQVIRGVLLFIFIILLHTYTTKIFIRLQLLYIFKFACDTRFATKIKEKEIKN